MATTVIKVQAATGQTEVTITANGGSGTASNPYTLTRIAGTLCSISVPQALTGNWHCVDSAGVETLINNLVDEAVTVELGNVPTPAENAAAVWNAATDDHNTAGSFGANLDVAVSSVSGGGGSIPSTFSAIVFTFDDDETEDPVPNVAIEINGYALQISGIDGVARIYVPNNAAYTVRIIPPYGYSIPTPIEVTVVEDDVPRAVSLEKVTAPALSEEDDCECTLQVVTAHNVPITGAKMVAATASEATFTTESLVFPTTVTAESESGMILINLIQGVTYDISVTYEGRAVRTQITVPASGSANIATLVV